jgi:hypothetical protein
MMIIVGWDIVGESGNGNGITLNNIYFYSTHSASVYRTIELGPG